MITRVQKPVEVPQVEYVDHHVHVPVQKQRHVPVVQMVQKMVDVPQVEFVDHHIHVPVLGKALFRTAPNQNVCPSRR